MGNVSLKEQLQAVASQLSDTVVTEQKAKSRPKKKFHPQEEKLKKPKPRWLEYVQYGIELLKVYFPACFKPANEVKPLKKGIKHDLVMRLSSMSTIVTEDKACMVKSLSYYVNTMAYHKCAVADAIRIDLDGNPAGVVTAEEARYSIDKQQSKLRAKQQMTTVLVKPGTVKEPS